MLFTHTQRNRWQIVQEGYLWTPLSKWTDFLSTKSQKLFSNSSPPLNGCFVVQMNDSPTHLLHNQTHLFLGGISTLVSYTGLSNAKSKFLILAFGFFFFFKLDSDNFSCHQDLQEVGYKLPYWEYKIKSSHKEELFFFPPLFFFFLNWSSWKAAELFSSLSKTERLSD